MVVNEKKSCRKMVFLVSLYIALLFSQKMDPLEALIFLVKKACNKRKEWFMSRSS